MDAKLDDLSQEEEDFLLNCLHSLGPSPESNNESTSKPTNSLESSAASLLTTLKNPTSHPSTWFTEKKSWKVKTDRDEGPDHSKAYARTFESVMNSGDQMKLFELFISESTPDCGVSMIYPFNPAGLSDEALRSRPCEYIEMRGADTTIKFMTCEFLAVPDAMISMKDSKFFVNDKDSSSTILCSFHFQGTRTQDVAVSGEYTVGMSKNSLFNSKYGLSQKPPTPQASSSRQNSISSSSDGVVAGAQSILKTGSYDGADYSGNRQNQKNPVKQVQQQQQQPVTNNNNTVIDLSLDEEGIIEGIVAAENENETQSLGLVQPPAQTQQVNKPPESTTSKKSRITANGGDSGVGALERSGSRELQMRMSGVTLSAAPVQSTISEPLLPLPPQEQNHHTHAKISQTDSKIQLPQIFIPPSSTATSTAPSSIKSNKRKKPPVSEVVVTTNQSHFSLCPLQSSSGPVTAMDIIGTIKFYLDEAMKIHKLEVVCRNRPQPGML